MKKVLIYNTSNITAYICYGRPALMGSAYAVGKGGLSPTAYAYTPAVPDGEFGTACDSSLQVHTWREYAGNCIYVCDTLSMILIDGGYITFDYTTHQPIYHYYLKDYLGNNRITVSLADGRIEEVNHYYPFGGLMGDSHNATTQPYKYIGKELDRTHGLDWYDHGARHYDPVTGRWNVMDALAEKYYNGEVIKDREYE